MQKKTYKIVIAGDLLPSGKNIKLFQEGNAKSIFGEQICQLFLNADYSIINLEGALTYSVDMQLKVDPILKAPISAIKGIKKLGVKAVALANNHITDYCNKGYDDTIKTLEEAGIQYVGAGPNKNSIKKSLSINFGNRKICIYNVSETFFVKLLNSSSLAFKCLIMPSLTLSGAGLLSPQPVNIKLKINSAENMVKNFFKVKTSVKIYFLICICSILSVK